jgi:hypothetical protein
VARGCPQQGALSPLLWCLVVEELITGLNAGGIYFQKYTDEMSSGCGKIPKHDIWAHAVGPTICESMVCWTRTVVKPRQDGARRLHTKETPIVI